MTTIPDTNGIDIEPATALSEPVGNDDVLATLADFFDVTKEAVEEKSRRQEIVGIRMTIMYILREYAGMSFPSIGRLVGNRDHTTVIHAYNKTKKEVAEDPSILETLADPIALAEALKRRKEQVAEELKEMNAKLYAQALESIHSSKLTRSMPRERVIPERNMKILEMYREGLTLENMAGLFGVTRERVRQIVISTIQAMAINESISKGIVMDIDVVMEEETKKRKNAQAAKKSVKEMKKQEGPKRWSRYYDQCKECNSSVYPHVRKGVCMRCRGAYSGVVREKIILEHDSKCDICGITRPEAIGTQERDLYVMKDQTVLCRRHFLENSGQRMGHYRNHAWSRFHAACIKCGTNTVPHSARGYCLYCNPVLTSEQRERLIESKEGKCTQCGITRAEAQKAYATDFRFTKTEEILCMKCFTQYALGQRKLKGKGKRTSGHT